MYLYQFAKDRDAIAVVDAKRCHGGLRWRNERTTVLVERWFHGGTRRSARIGMGDGIHISGL